MFVLLLCFALLCPWALPREPQRWGVVCVRLLCVGSSDAPSLLLPRKPKLKSEECYCPCRGDEKGCGCAHPPFSTLFFLLFHDYSLQTITAALSTLGRSCACLQESCAGLCPSGREPRLLLWTRAGLCPGTHSSQCPLWSPVSYGTPFP